MIMALDALTIDYRITSAGDANVWIAPLKDGDTATVLLLTDTAGKSHAIRLAPTDLVAIHASAANVIAATPSDVEAWLDRAATEVINHYPTLREFGEMRS